MKCQGLLLGLFAAAGLAAQAQAGLITYNGTFDATLSPFAGLPPSISADFTFSFDESLLSGVGLEIVPIVIDSLTAFQLGSTTFSPANTGLILTYFNGDLANAVLGGMINDPSAVFGGTDDFSVTFIGITGLDGAQFIGAAAASSAPPAFAQAISPSSGLITIAAAAPEPSSLALAGIGGLIGIGCAWRHRSRGRVA